MAAVLARVCPAPPPPGPRASRVRRSPCAGSSRPPFRSPGGAGEAESGSSPGLSSPASWQPWRGVFSSSLVPALTRSMWCCRALPGRVRAAPRRGTDIRGEWDRSSRSARGPLAPPPRPPVVRRGAGARNPARPRSSALVRGLAASVGGGGVLRPSRTASARGPGVLPRVGPSPAPAAGGPSGPTHPRAPPRWCRCASSGPLAVPLERSRPSLRCLRPGGGAVPRSQPTLPVTAHARGRAPLEPRETKKRSAAERERKDVEKKRKKRGGSSGVRPLEHARLAGGCRAWSREGG